MRKTAQLVKNHLKGEVTAASEKAMSKIIEQLKKAGFKAPFKMKIAQNEQTCSECGRKKHKDDYWKTHRCPDCQEDYDDWADNNEG